MTAEEEEFQNLTTDAVHLISDVRKELEYLPSVDDLLSRAIAKIRLAEAVFRDWTAERHRHERVE